MFAIAVRSGCGKICLHGDSSVAGGYVEWVLVLTDTAAVSLTLNQPCNPRRLSFLIRCVFITIIQKPSSHVV